MDGEQKGAVVDLQGQPVMPQPSEGDIALTAEEVGEVNRRLLLRKHHMQTIELLENEFSAYITRCVLTHRPDMPPANHVYQFIKPNILRRIVMPASLQPPISPAAPTNGGQA